MSNEATPERYSYYIVFTYRNQDGFTVFGCRDVDFEGPLDDPERRKRLTAALAGQFPNVVIVNWQRNQ